MKRRLILVEGLPGSGKSTTAKIIGEVLSAKNISNKVILEGCLDHPADYDGVAYFTKKQYTDLLTEFSMYKCLINNISVKNEVGYFIEYKKAIYQDNIEISESLKRNFYSNDIYEIPFETHRELIKLKWQEFSLKSLNDDSVYIFECPFIQNPVTVTMIKDNLSKDTIISYIKEVESIIKKLNPLVVYVKQQDIAFSFNRVSKCRPEGWLNFFINYYTKQGYGSYHHLDGLLGAIEVLKAREKLEVEILENLDIDYIVVDNSEFNIEKHKEIIEKTIMV